MVDAKIYKNTVIITLLICELLPYACIIFSLHDFDTTFTLSFNYECGIIHDMLLP